VATTCCAAAESCAQDDSCAAHQRCYRSCKDPSCPIRCDDEQTPGSGGGPVKTDLDTCLAAGCGADCKHGAQWGCVGKLQWPAPDPSKQVVYTIPLVGFVSGDPFPNAVVRACAPNDYACSMPLAFTTADAMGVAKLSLDSGFT